MIFGGTNADACGVCYEKISLAALVVVCSRGHVFHERCAHQWKRGLICPQDRHLMGDRVNTVHILGQRLLLPLDAKAIGNWICENLTECEENLAAIEAFIENLPTEQDKMMARTALRGCVLILQGMANHYTIEPFDVDASSIIEQIDTLLHPYRDNIVAIFADVPIHSIIQRSVAQLNVLFHNIYTTNSLQGHFAVPGERMKILGSLDFLMDTVDRIRDSTLYRDLISTGNMRFVQRHVAAIAQMPTDQARIQYIMQIGANPQGRANEWNPPRRSEANRLKDLLERRPTRTRDEELALRILNTTLPRPGTRFNGLSRLLSHPLAAFALLVFVMYVILSASMQMNYKPRMRFY